MLDLDRIQNIEGTTPYIGYIDVWVPYPSILFIITGTIWGLTI